MGNKLSFRKQIIIDIVNSSQNYQFIDTRYWSDPSLFDSGLPLILIESNEVIKVTSFSQLSKEKKIIFYNLHSKDCGKPSILITTTKGEFTDFDLYRVTLNNVTRLFEDAFVEHLSTTNKVCLPF